MPEQKKLPLSQQQVANKPKIEDMISEYLDNGMKKLALDFVDFLRTNKVQLRLIVNVNSLFWKAYYKSKVVCALKIANNSWTISPINWPLTQCDYSSGYDRIINDVKLKKAMWNNINYCKGCNKKDIPVRASVFGKEFDNVCWMVNVNFIDPDADAVKCAKIIAEQRCNDIKMAMSLK